MRSLPISLEAKSPTLRAEAVRKRRIHRGALPSHLPRIESVVDIDSKSCPGCHSELHRIGENVSEKLDVVPTQFRVAGLIDNLLDFARGRLGGGITLSRVSDVDLKPLLDQVVGELRVGLQGREILTEFELTQTVDVGPIRFAQLVSNLLGNALTHGALDQPVRVYAATANGEVEVSMSNGGSPIPPEAMEKLFQPFFRGKVRGNLQGLGLGLHVASEIAAAHGGKLTVQSSDEETRFTLRMQAAALSA